MCPRKCAPQQVSAVGSEAIVRTDILIKADPVLHIRQDRRNLRLARGIERSFCGKRVKKRIAARLILRVGQAVAAFCGIDQSLLGGPLPVDGAAPGKPVGNLPESSLHRVVILRGIIVALRPGIFQIAAV